MRNKLLTFFGFLLMAMIVWNGTACATTNNIGHAQTNTADKELSNSTSNNANNHKTNSTMLSENSNLVVQKETEEKPCDVELEESPKKTSPSYNLKVSKTGKVTLDDATRKSLNEWFSIFAGAWLEPFSEGKVKDEQLISFANTRLFGLSRDGGLSKEPKKETARCKVTEACTARVDEKEIEKVIEKYFQLRMKKHGFSEQPSRYKYKAGCYIVDMLCSDGEMTFSFAVVEKIISLKDDYYLADVKNYTGWYSLFSECNGDCDRKRLQEIKNASEVSDFETIMKLCPRWEASPTDKMRAKFRIVKSGEVIRPILVSYEKIKSFSKN
jgi:hypothetical protein